MARNHEAGATEPQVVEQYEDNHCSGCARRNHQMGQDELQHHSVRGKQRDCDES